ncbi:MAG TPA: DUF779 domain-containing protein [Candidatus Dormibacteraeota bacterium]|nr:DUF779 domain-containing protein [Candidatus Dormibacteraeota bacterium]
MAATVVPQRVDATEAALEAIDRLQAARRPVMFFMSGGCCDGSLPICLPEHELITGPTDVLLGRIGGCEFWIDTAQDAAWGQPRFLLDIAPGAPEGFSLGTLDGDHFVAHSSGSPDPRCALPSDPGGDGSAFACAPDEPAENVV